MKRLNDALAYFNRGLAYGRKGEHDKAIAEYTEAIRIDPNPAVAYFSRGIAYLIIDEKAKAAADIAKAKELGYTP